MTFRFGALLAAPLTLAPAAALAADIGSVGTMRSAVVQSDPYIVTLTANGQFMSRFPGSDEITGVYYPSVNIRRASEPPRFAAPDDGFSISVIDDDPAIRFGPVARFQGGRYYSDDRRLVGLRKINWSVEPGVFLEYFPVSWIRARIELRYATNGAEGLVGNAGVDFIKPWDRFTFSLGPRINFAGEEYMRDYFGVTPFQAALSGGRFTAFRPGASIVSAGALGSVSYTWNDQWSSTGYGGYNRLVDDAARSPITRRIGSADEFVFGASVSYSFIWNR